MLLKFASCDALELWLKEEEGYFRCRTVLCLAGCFHFQVLPRLRSGQLDNVQKSALEAKLARISMDLIHRRYDTDSPNMTPQGSFYSGNVQVDLFLDPSPPPSSGAKTSSEDSNYQSVAIIPLQLSQLNIGIMWIKSRRPDVFHRGEIEMYEDIVEVLAVTLINQRARAACRERVKELTCLYGIAKAAEQPGNSLEQLLRSITDQLPPAWQYPEQASARIVIDGRSFETPKFWDGQQKQSAEIIVNEKHRGIVEVVYAGNQPELDEGPFLKEERTLLDSVARQVAMILEQREAEEQREMLEDQLRHADRLATIGQLAAGVAHELNEPLGSILGFAQLTQKDSQLSAQTREDIKKIVGASLYAREIVNKLKLFARQTPPQKALLDLNELVKEGLIFLSSRCAKADIEMVRHLDPNLPAIVADKGQIHQVLVNLVVNAIQAMPSGGRLTISTRSGEDVVELTVEDNGVGMDTEVRKKIFIPFFTTKEVSEGTGLGLAVVDGIISSHNGSISVESVLGQGSRFSIRLPLGTMDATEEIKSHVT